MRTNSKILMLSILFALFGCGQNNSKTENYNENKELVPNPQGKQKAIFIASEKELTIGDDCKCVKNDYGETKADTIFKLENGKRIALCGYRNPESNPIDFSEFVLSVCGENKIIDFWGATQTCYLKTDKDTLFVEELINLPTGKNRTFLNIVWTSEKIFFKNQEIVRKISVNKNITKYSKAEISKTLQEFENANTEINEEKMELANRLFIATISNDKTARKYFKEFKTKFGILDGAFSEEYSDLKSMLEIWDLR
jgi:hypothetical protein